jgi:hypothetical protein
MKNPTFVRQLEAAKKYLWDGVLTSHGCIPFDRERYICICLLNSDDVGDVTKLRSVIESRLDGAADLDNWLALNGVPYYERTDKRLQAHRLAWINKLIEEFS